MRDVSAVCLDYARTQGGDPCEVLGNWLGDPDGYVVAIASPDGSALEQVIRSTR